MGPFSISKEIVLQRPSADSDWDIREIKKISGRIYRLHLNTESSGSVGVAIGNGLTIIARDNDPVLEISIEAGFEHLCDQTDGEDPPANYR